MPTAAAYIRVSTEDQMEFSPDSQLRNIQAYALNHHIELLPAHIYLDEGISGRNTSKRPAFLQMIADAKRKPHPFDLILLWKFSRFARNRQDSIFYKSMLRRECGIDVISITEPLSPDPKSSLFPVVSAAFRLYLQEFPCCYLFGNIDHCLFQSVRFYGQSAAASFCPDGC